MRFQIITFIVVLLVSFSATASERGRETLRGLGRMDVFVEKFDAEEKAAGLNERTIKTTVELRLRMAGIAVDSDAAEYVYVNVTAVIIEGRLRAFNVALDLRQPVTLRRDRSVSSVAATWHIAVTAVSSRPAEALEILDEMMDEFLNDYLAENPKTL